MNRLYLIFPVVNGLSSADCNPAFLDCTTPPTRVDPVSITKVQYSTIVGQPPPITWLDPVPIPALPKINIADSLATINQQMEQAQQNGNPSFFPTLPPLQGLPGVTITGNSKQILERASLIMQLAGLQSTDEMKNYATTTPSPFVTISIGFGDLPTFPPDLPIMQYRPNIAGWIRNVTEASPAVVQLQAMIESGPMKG